MKIVSRNILIVLCALNAVLVAATASEARAEEESNNEIKDDENVATDAPDLFSEEIKSGPANADVAVKDDNDGTENLSLETQFDDAVESYLNNDWENCIDKFEIAVKSFKKYKEMIVGCRRKCRAEANAAKPIFAVDVEDIQFYERKVRETLCLMKCKKITQGTDVKAKLVPEYVEFKFIERRPYEYIHICYYQMKRHQDAANAIFTFLVLHRDHEMSKKNLRFYVDLPDVVEDEVVDLETDPFLNSYKAGVEAYNDENWPAAIKYFENSVKAYMEAEDNCRLYCEGPFNQGWFPEFTMSIANHFVYGLRCKRSCSSWLNNVNGEQRPELLMNHYHYLQYAYFQLGEFKEACAAVESFLRFVPNDETVLQNKKYFRGLPEVTKEYFVPREDALAYVRRQEYELRMMLYIQNEFTKI